MNEYLDKFNNSISNTFYFKLPLKEQVFIKDKALEYRFSHQEIRELLSNESIEVELLSKKYGKKVYYNKYITLNKEYGVSVLWD